MMFLVWFCLFSMEFTLLKFYTLMERSISFDIKRSVVTEIEEEKCRWTEVFCSLSYVRIFFLSL